MFNRINQQVNQFFLSPFSAGLIKTKRDKLEKPVTDADLTTNASAAAKTRLTSPRATQDLGGALLSKGNQGPLSLPARNLDNTVLSDIKFALKPKQKEPEKQTEVKSDKADSKYPANFNKLVNVQYQQYQKAEQPFYSRGELGEMLRYLAPQTPQPYFKEKQAPASEGFLKRAKDVLNILTSEPAPAPEVFGLA